MQRTYPTLLAWLCAALLVASCGGEESAAPGGEPAAREPAARVATPADLDQALILSLSVFPVGPDGKSSTKPGPATLVILRREGGAWTEERIEDPESNVFHKALPFTPPGGPPGILTIAGSGARLKLWRKRGNAWQAETLWGPDFGGKHSRLRDVELADLDGDGTDEIVLATHDQGVVAIVDVGPDGVEISELDRSASTFVHEIELGDLDRDAALEIYATPSAPNKMDGKPQSGRVTRYPADGSGPGGVFVDLGDRHAKEILVADLDADGTEELYVAVEGRIDGGRRVESVEIRRYRDGQSEGEVIAELQDHLCRVLVPADVDGDGAQELIAAPFRAGLWLLRPGPGRWEQVLIDRDSSGFEHATAAFDLDGDGKDEIYTAADDQGAVRRYVWNGSGFDREEIFEPGGELKGFTWNVTTAPVELTR
jgi:hypothetical protein